MLTLLDQAFELTAVLLALTLHQGYDTEVVENQIDALNYFKSQEVFPDIVIIDTDHSYNTIQVCMQWVHTMHAKHAAVAVQMCTAAAQYVRGAVFAVHCCSAAPPLLQCLPLECCSH